MPSVPPGPSSRPLSAGGVVVRLGVIGVILACFAGAFAYAGGWLSPNRLTPDRVLAAIQEDGHMHPGFRRNHAKGVCAAGWFDSNGQAAALSKAAVFQTGHFPVIARFSLAGSLPFQPDTPQQVRAMALRVLPPSGEEWRAAHDQPAGLRRQHGAGLLRAGHERRPRSRDRQARSGKDAGAVRGPSGNPARARPRRAPQDRRGLRRRDLQQPPTRSASSPPTAPQRPCAGPSCPRAARLAAHRRRPPPRRRPRPVTRTTCSTS